MQETTVSPVTLLKIQRQTAYRCQAANKPIHTGQRKPGFQENPEPTSKQWSPALIWCQTAPAGKQGARISFHTSGQTEQTRAVASFGFGFYRTCTDPRVRACPKCSRAASHTVLNTKLMNSTPHSGNAIRSLTELLHRLTKQKLSHFPDERSAHNRYLINTVCLHESTARCLLPTAPLPTTHPSPLCKNSSYGMNDCVIGC